VNQTDSQLLRAYAEHRSEAAFAELVRRHVNLVYSAALRMVCDSHLAQDVTQGVFVALAKNATQLTDRSVLSGWLHRTVQNIAAQNVRTDVRRRTREQEVAAMNEILAPESEASWEHIAPHLDTALSELSEPDRDALLLRYFERKSAIEMAQILVVSDEAAQKRVSRAIERLRKFLAKHGITVGASGLVAVVSANAVQAAPIGLAVTISTAVVLGGTTIATTATATAINTIAMTTLQKTIIAVTLTAAIGIAIYQVLETSRLRSQIRELQQTLTNQTQTVESKQLDSSNRLASLQEENNRLNRNATELLKLRGEVNRLRRQIPALSAVTPTPLVEETITNTPPFQTYSVTNQVDLDWGQTLVAGGWKIPSGDRVLLLATLAPLEDASQLMLHVKIAEIAKENLTSVWPDGMATDGNDSKTGILEREQFDPFVKNLTQSGASRVRDMAMTTMTGRECLIQMGDKPEDFGMIGVMPKISADGKTVNLKITSNLNYPTKAEAKK
jgi:RNA polymerase sigma factor (sigma-70 family)